MSTAHSDASGDEVQVHPQASEKDISALLSTHGTVTKVSKVVTLSEAGPHAVAHVTLSSEKEAQVRWQTAAALLLVSVCPWCHCKR